MPEIATFIDVSYGKIESAIFEGEPDKPIMLMCHPHSLMGGTMNNKVVTTVTRAFSQLGCTTVRFNFRGVGLSGGEYQAGIGEAEDVNSIIQWLGKRWPNRQVILGGFSFGAYVALRAAQTAQLKALLLIAPAVGNMDFSGLKLPVCPSYLIVAGEDEVVSTTAILEWATTFSFKDIFNITDASHFFHGRLLLIRDYILKEFKACV